MSAAKGKAVEGGHRARRRERARTKGTIVVYGGVEHIVLEDRGHELLIRPKEGAGGRVVVARDILFGDVDPGPPGPRRTGEAGNE